jgi:hypothetical protein
MKWYQADTEGEGVEILRELATALGSTCFASLVYLEGVYESDG